MTVVVGGSLLASAVTVLGHSRYGRFLALLAGLILIGWIAVQVAMIGYVSCMQPAVAVAALVILVLAYWLPDPLPPGICVR